jgi:hypothetical protein
MYVLLDFFLATTPIASSSNSKKIMKHHAFDRIATAEKLKGHHVFSFGNSWPSIIERAHARVETQI